MKKEIIIFLIMLNILILLPIVNSNENNYTDLTTGSTIIGEVTNANLGVSVTIYFGEPLLTIIEPKNQTYITSKNLPLNFFSKNIQTIWYNTNSGTNITITGNTTFNTTQGSRILYLYGNNSDGNFTFTNRSFSVNESILTILYDSYKNSAKGESTNFAIYTYEELQNLEGIILENTNYGKISFNQAINITDNLFPENREVNIDNNANISFNRIELNSTALPNFNKSATLHLYNLTFSNPRILKDGSLCPSTICTINDYTGGTLSFNVTKFSVYSAEETPTETPPIISGGRGGGIITEKRFSLDKDRIAVSLKQGQTTSQKILITNLENEILKVNLENTFLKDFIRLSEAEFYLNAKESIEIEIDFIVREDTLPDLYIGKIIATVGETQKEILITIEVESKGPLFDVKIRIPYKFQHVLPGEEALAQIEIYNLGSDGKIDVFLDYIIKDSKGNEILKEQGTIAVETSTSFIKDIKIPENLAFGKYVFYVRVTYDGKIASASAWFNVGKRELDKLTIFLYILIIILIIIILMIIREIRKIKKYLKPIYRVDESLLIKKGLVKIKR